MLTSRFCLVFRRYPSTDQSLVVFVFVPGHIEGLKNYQGKYMLANNCKLWQDLMHIYRFTDISIYTPFILTVIFLIANVICLSHERGIWTIRFHVVVFSSAKMGLDNLYYSIVGEKYYCLITFMLHLYVQHWFTIPSYMGILARLFRTMWVGV